MMEVGLMGFDKVERRLFNVARLVGRLESTRLRSVCGC